MVFAGCKNKNIEASDTGVTSSAAADDNAAQGEGVSDYSYPQALEDLVNEAMYSISDDLEVWFKELADPYIDCEYKAFWRPSPMQLSSEYNECKNLEDFLDVSSKASSYYVLRFLIVLPSQAVDCDIIAMTKSISSAMQEKRIRGHITMRVYVDDVVYDQIKSKKDQRHFWTHQYRNIFCTFAVEKDFNITEVDKFQKGGFWHLDDETYNKEILNNN